MMNQYWWSIYRLVLGSNKAQTADVGGHFSQSLVGAARGGQLASQQTVKI